tara:strand:- start:2 stop:220 length:219 start_codon:yes stop_codon:yes gene_type:complete
MKINKDDHCCDNTWSKFGNKKFTYAQLLGAMKFNLVKYDDLPDDVKPLMLEYLKQQGYLRPAYFKQAVRNKI